MIRVLHVDDERLLLDLTKEFLEQQEPDFQVDTAISAKEALQKLLEEEYDVVVSDYRMPGMDGLEFLSELRKQGNEIPFIMFTGKGREEVAVEVFKRGANGYIMKGGSPSSQYTELAQSIRESAIRKRAEKALRQSERRLLNIIENLGAGLTISDRNTITTYANPRSAEMLGYTPAEMIGKHGRSLIHKDSLAERDADYADRRKGVTSLIELNLAAKDGRPIPVMKIGTPILDEKGEFDGSYSITIDLTERKKMEELLRSSEKKYRTLVELANDGIMVTEGTERTITFTNRRFAEMLGYTVEELLGKSYIDLIHPGETEEYLTHKKFRLKSGKPEMHERRLIRKDGSTLHIIVSSSNLDPNDKSASAPAINTFTDITKRKGAEEALRQSEERYRTLVELAHDGIILTEGPNRTISYANQRFTEMLGYTLGGLIGKSYRDFVHPDDREDYRTRRGLRLVSGKADTRERRLIRKDGSTLYTLLSVSFINPEDRTESAPAICIFTDITGRKRIEDRERYLHSLLRHDLTNKFQGAYGYLELLNRTGLSEKQEEYIENLQGLHRDAIELIEDIRYLRIIDEAEEPVNVDLDLVIRNAIEDLSASAEKQGIAIDYKGIPNAMVTASPLLKNTFTNLIGNNIKHAECEKITITVKELKDGYHITVKDDGKGIPKSVREKLFERGVKGTGSSGSGLGLHLVKRIIETSGGTIELKDTKKGTRFDIYLKKAGSTQGE